MMKGTVAVILFAIAARGEEAVPPARVERPILDAPTDVPLDYGSLLKAKRGVPSGAEQLWNVRAELLDVQVPVSAGLPLKLRLQNPAAAEGAVEELLALVATGKATLLAAPVVVARSGENAVAEANEEIRFPSEFDMPTGEERWAGKPPKPLMAKVRRMRGEPINVPATIESRNIGVTIEMTPVVAPGGRTLDVNLVPQRVSFNGMRRVLADRVHAYHGVNEQPQFRTLKTSTVLTVDSGMWTLVGSFVVAPDRFEFFLLRATAILVSP